MRSKTTLLTLVVLGLAAPGSARADVESDPVNVGGYFRVMTRPDFQGGSGRLGYSNLYGRLLNEGPYAALELRLSILDEEPGRHNVWTSLHAKVEGGSVANADAGQGSLERYALSQLYAKLGNVLVDGVTWQLGTLDAYMGDVGLYDLRVAEIFFETLGLSARYVPADAVEVLVGIGDAGYGLRGLDYSTIPTAGGWVRLNLGSLQLGVGGQVLYEPGVKGNRFAPYQTPDVAYEDYLRGEVVEHWLEEHPGQEDLFPPPSSRSSSSYKAIAYVGFGGFGPLEWNGLYASIQRQHPDNFTTETFEGRDYTIFIKELTDERTRLTLADQLQLRVVPGLVDVAIAGLLGVEEDADDDVSASERNRTFGSIVARAQVYVLPTVHLLAETSYAVETSSQGNLFRTHFDSVFASEDGRPDTRGLEQGDSDTRTTWQGKAGLVLNPLGPGLFTRPSLRILYGVQHSSQNAAFGNSFVESLDQFNYFGGTEQHWHHVLALEVEAWF